MACRVGEFIPSDRAEMGESTLPLELFLSCWKSKDEGVSRGKKKEESRLYTRQNSLCQPRSTVRALITTCVPNPPARAWTWNWTDPCTRSSVYSPVNHLPLCQYPWGPAKSQNNFGRRQNDSLHACLKFWPENTCRVPKNKNLAPLGNQTNKKGKKPSA